ncbi:DHS-like NAD/FAD-binding domain-containing protein [Acrodontium crateriforme]|uniref:DHS-like NAD/FAD-binding domain-containing protein n=1 Tax=Acrodontium crateriforme TaxID=150365 RepID=A0AAQ3M0P6_9PEZI|nr:DHS-like NAD/FAD-binding domain-containing protein [Acrodontium crateriforme]
MTSMPLMRIPYTTPLPSPTIIPSSASTLQGAVAALGDFITAPARSGVGNGKTVILSGAGISVASGLADYRGTNGTYTLNKTYRPIYFHEFSASHEARKRYWARSYLGWTNLHRSSPNKSHVAVANLGKTGLLSSVITQNVDSFHSKAHPTLRTLELHGYLRSTVCLSCRTEYNRDEFQKDLSNLNPSWATFLDEMLKSGALTTENPEARRSRGLKTNPDGDVDVPDVEYTTFRYPACPVCLKNPPKGTKVELDDDGAWSSTSTAGVLKPAVIMFGESIPGHVKLAVESAIDEASRMLILGSSLATYSAWRLVKRAKEQGKPIAIVNIGGVRGEEQFVADISSDSSGAQGLRCSLPLEDVLPALVGNLSPDTSKWSTMRNDSFQPAPWR